ncbi:E-selectin-like [Styela clava]
MEQFKFHYFNRRFCLIFWKLFFLIYISTSVEAGGITPPMTCQPHYSLFPSYVKQIGNWQITCENKNGDAGYGTICRYHCINNRMITAIREYRHIQCWMMWDQNAQKLITTWNGGLGKCGFVTCKSTPYLYGIRMPSKCDPPKDEELGYFLHTVCNYPCSTTAGINTIVCTKHENPTRKQIPNVGYWKAWVQQCKPNDCTSSPRLMPRSQILECDKEVDEYNGIYKFNTSCTVLCDQNYNVTHRKPLLCLNKHYQYTLDSEWWPDAPTCVRKTLDCAPLYDPLNREEESFYCLADNENACQLICTEDRYVFGPRLIFCEPHGGAMDEYGLNGYWKGEGFKHSMMPNCNVSEPHFKRQSSQESHTNNAR